ncbi:LPS-assembly protein LptD [Pseudooceanicola sediminis]|uniref:LPS-assembly protein LptD n=1 Tax=Pseudooceanicola sediminis TaxID=2211117 RepID=A0A399J596_9RHOB|nr:LPS assembly protein LptD [Pseudooceanicola sediminis]KAA2316908.1 LPS-assembly protein LptD [Puniceibacterium sp. HSS470]RII40638.1 LPS-assembly protein LptD [Pseudooceanicola sediminis]|tara:strand:+ start:86159 stop:88456 length:2298 start_codon:yes stop_codon:yes gene_type:complete
MPTPRPTSPAHVPALRTALRTARPRRGLRRLACATALGAALLSGTAIVPLTVQAQTAGQTADQSETANDAVLIADRVFLDGRERIIAEGNVEVLQGTSRLRASRVVYDQDTDHLTLEGPITLTEESATPDGPVNTIVLADSGELDRDMRNGLLNGARMMLDQQVQIAATQLSRVEGRYSQLYKTTVSSCHVCQDGKSPLWQIRASRVVHDTVERQLYFDNAIIEVLGLPVFYLPHLRLPDPSQRRATGFLLPSIKRNSLLETGLKLPYFISIDDQRDLTLTPYVSSKTKTLEYRYRQAFSNGALSINGALSKDTLSPGPMRGYLEAAGKFYLPRDFELKFNIEAVGDDSYLTDYDYSDKDRLDSEVAIQRASRDEWIHTALTFYHSMRTTEDNATIPSIIGDADYEKRLFPTSLGGEVRLGFDLHGHFRSSDQDFDGTDADTITDGRDVTRLTTTADWLRTWTLPMGVRAEVLGGIAIDSFRTSQDISLPESETGVTPTGAVTLRWPLQKVAASGATHILEPVAQIAWSGGHALDIANDESTRPELDEGNLLGLTRFAAPDRRERGWRGAYGLQWSRFTPAGWQSQLVLGQVVQEHPDSAMTRSSGLQETFSDFLIGGQVKTPGGLSITARGLFDTELQANKAEGRASWSFAKASIGASYIWLGPDTVEKRPDVLSEWALGGAYQVTPNWGASANIRYDVAADSPASAGLGITYVNECVDVAFSLSRSFASSTVVTPSTAFAFTIGLRGFSAGTAGGPVQGQCRN